MKWTSDSKKETKGPINILCVQNHKSECKLKLLWDSKISSVRIVTLIKKTKNI